MFVYIRYLNDKYEFKTLKIDHSYSKDIILFSDETINTEIANKKIYSIRMFSESKWLRTAYKSDYDGRIKRDYPQIYILFEVFKIYKLL